MFEQTVFASKLRVTVYTKIRGIDVGFGEINTNPMYHTQVSLQRQPASEKLQSAHSYLAIPHASRISIKPHLECFSIAHTQLFSAKLLEFS